MPGSQDWEGWATLTWVPKETFQGRWPLSWRWSSQEPARRSARNVFQADGITGAKIWRWKRDHRVPGGKKRPPYLQCSWQGHTGGKRARRAVPSLCARIKGYRVWTGEEEVMQFFICLPSRETRMEASIKDGCLAWGRKRRLRAGPSHLLSTSYIQWQATCFISYSTSAWWERDHSLPRTKLETEMEAEHVGQIIPLMPPAHPLGQPWTLKTQTRGTLEANLSCMPSFPGYVSPRMRCGPREEPALLPYSRRAALTPSKAMCNCYESTSCIYMYTHIGIIHLLHSIAIAITILVKPACGQLQ